MNVKWPAILISLLLLHTAATPPDTGAEHSSGHTGKAAWVDSVFRSLTPEQRIAQLLVIRVYSNRSPSYNDSMNCLISTWNPGGVCFFQGTPYAQAMLTNLWQRSAQTPLLVAIDAEWGLGMRLDSAYSFPFQMTLGASSGDSLVYEMGSLIGRACRRSGIHINLAPVVDVNNNPKNPVISFRSFGEDPVMVATKGNLYVQGLQHQGVMATAKHFPGHGDTDTDSHHALPVIWHDKQRLDAVELIPFRYLAIQGVKGVMIAHLAVPAYDNTPDLATTLSPAIVNGLLKTRMGFRGFAITDALDMKGVTAFFPPGEIEVRALLAGNDILLLPQDIGKAVSAIRKAVEESRVPEELVNQTCKRILELKYDAGLHTRVPVKGTGITADLNPPEAEALSARIYQSAVTLLRNTGDLIPIRYPKTNRIAVLSIGTSSPTRFQEELSWYAPVTTFTLPRNAPKEQIDRIRKEVSGFGLVIIGLHRNNLYPKDHFGIPAALFTLIREISSSRPVILTIFGNPYIINSLQQPEKLQALLVTYQDQDLAETTAAQVIFGGIGAGGTLPVTTLHYPVGSGIKTSPVRLSTIIPEEIGIPSGELRRIDSLAIGGIRAGAYPGCQIILARDGRVFYDKTFGSDTYDQLHAVDRNDLYDLASLTKIMATTLAVMRLYEDGLVSLDARLSDYLPELTGSDKESMTIREIMAHQAGLQPWIPFYLTTLADSLDSLRIYAGEPSSRHPVRVANQLYMQQAWQDSIFGWIIRSKLRPVRDYKYSDLGFYLLMKLVERQTGESFRTFLETTFYQPLGLTTLGFLPREQVPLSRIMPTENDTVFRKQLLRGDVHDPGAAMLGGISGHAGLFGNSRDLAIILQMLLNEGEYGGIRFFQPVTVKEFTRGQFPAEKNRRGLGFDKPPRDYEPNGPVCPGASPYSFGHTGFTGVYCWADPVNGLSYVFLSNRIHPDAFNGKISKLNIRTSIHQQAYEILQEAFVK